MCLGESTPKDTDSAPHHRCDRLSFSCFQNAAQVGMRTSETYAWQLEAEETLGVGFGRSSSIRSKSIHLVASNILYFVRSSNHHCATRLMSPLRPTSSKRPQTLNPDPYVLRSLRQKLAIGSLGMKERILIVVLNNSL